MKYRAIYQEKTNQAGFYEVVSAFENDSNVITTTGQKFMVDELEDLVWKLSSNGVDISFMWKNGMIPRIVPFRNEIQISPCPLDGAITRKSFVHETNTRYSSKQTHFNVVVRHFDRNGDHIIDPYDDILVNRILDNNEIVNIDGHDWGEWDYMYHLVVNDIATQISLEDQRITIMDQNGVFGSEIYDI